LGLTFSGSGLGAGVGASVAAVGSRSSNWNGAPMLFDQASITAASNNIAPNTGIALFTFSVVLNTRQN
jgi:hypothetical protein